ncbi:MAG: calcium-binding protein [Gemmatimonadaceae bacterium]
MHAPRHVPLPFRSLLLLAAGGLFQGCDRGLPLEHPSNAERAAELSEVKRRHAVDLGRAPSLSLDFGVAAAISAPGEASADPIPFAPESEPFAHVVALGDDVTSGLRPIGFEFVFFGVRYSAFNISSNGFIGFDASMGQGCCSGGVIPVPDDVNNIIAAAWTDLYPPGGGQIAYETRGQAPNRRLVVSFRQLPWYPEAGIDRVTTQIILYEGTNVIEIHTARQSAGHIYTQGVEDATGTRAAFLPGRVAANFGLLQSAVRFFTPQELQPATCFGLPATITGAGTIVGTPGNDVILGSAGPDVINGLGGDDRICGLGGDDRLFGGDGNDRLHGGDGNDLVEGQNGDDLIEGGDGNDNVQGNAGDDDVQGNMGDDLVFGHAGNDSNDGGLGADDRCFDPQGGTFARCEVTGAVNVLTLLAPASDARIQQNDTSAPERSGQHRLRLAAQLEVHKVRVSISASDRVAVA